jgi:hypothetical protein
MYKYIKGGGIVVFDISIDITLSSSGVSTSSLSTNRRKPHILDERGAALNCSSIMRDTYELVVGRDEGI